MANVETMRLHIPTVFISLALLAASLLIGGSVAGANTGVDAGNPGCVIERGGNPETATIRYAPGIGVSVNLRDDSGWVATLGVNGSEFADDESSTGYTLIRRDESDTRQDFTCAETVVPSQIVVTGPGCVIERTDALNTFGRLGVAVIHYAPGIGSSVNLLGSQGSWIATLDIDGTEFTHDRSLSGYSIIRRSNGVADIFDCTEADEAPDNEPRQPTPPPPPVPVADGPIVVTGPGCVVERLGERNQFGFTGDSVIHYESGIGTSVNLLGSRIGWIATLDLDGSEFEEDRSLEQYTLRRRDNGVVEDYVCTELDEPRNNTPEPAPTPPTPRPPVAVADGPIVVTGPGCVIERFGEPLRTVLFTGTATIHYAPGIGESVNLRSTAGWIATLDVDGTSFEHDESPINFSIIRRDADGNAEEIACTELGDPANGIPVLTVNEG